MVFILYQAFYIIFILFYMLGFAFKKRRREGIAMRLGIYPNELKDKLSRKDNIWIHAVSVGEVMVTKVLVDRIRKDLSRYNIVVSTITETGNSVARETMGKDATVIYLPLDLSFAVKRAIEVINPAIFIIIETEIWPNLIINLHKKNVPIILSNGRISKKSYSCYFLVRPFLKNILDCITSLLMRSKEDADRIISLGAETGKVTVVGNMKFDSVDFSVDDELRQKLYDALGLENKKLIVAGSTHPGEEEVLLKAYKSIRKKYNDVSVLIAPRHIERTEDIARLIKSYGFTPIRISELTVNCKLSTVNSYMFILDTIGQLKFFYSVAWIAFVGGSLIKHGGQNMIEPACFSKPILFGPYTFNFRDIATLFLKEKAALLVKDRESLVKSIKMLYEDEPFAKGMGRRAQEIIKDNQGAADRTVNMLKTILQC